MSPLRRWCCAPAARGTDGHRRAGEAVPPVTIPVMAGVRPRQVRADRERDTGLHPPGPDQRPNRAISHKFYISIRAQAVINPATVSLRMANLS